MITATRVFLFTGDMTAKAEKELIEDGADIKCDVLKVGHRGSSGSSCYQFLLRGRAEKIGVISCGRDNDYGHPHEETLSRLSDAGVTVYRTDLEGSIVIFSDGMKVEREGSVKDKSYSKAIAAAIVAQIFWGLSFLASSIGQESASPFVLMSYRFDIALLALTVPVLLGKRKLESSRKKRKAAAASRCNGAVHLLCRRAIRA